MSNSKENARISEDHEFKLNFLLMQWISSAYGVFFFIFYFSYLLLLLAFFLFVQMLSHNIDLLSYTCSRDFLICIYLCFCILACAFLDGSSSSSFLSFRESIHHFWYKINIFIYASINFFSFLKTAPIWGVIF